MDAQAKLGPYEYHVVDSPKELERLVATGKADVAFNGLSMRNSSSENMAFTYAVNHTGLQIMVLKNSTVSVEAILIGIVKVLSLPHDHLFPRHHDFIRNTNRNHDLFF